MRFSCKHRLVLFLSVLLIGCATTPSVQDQATAETNMLLGLSSVQQGHFQQAAQTLMQAVHEDPTNPRIKDALAYAYEKSGDTTAADHWYQAAIAQSPDDGALHNNDGAFLCRQKRFSEAEQQFVLAEQSPGYAHPDIARENAARCGMKN